MTYSQRRWEALIFVAVFVLGGKLLLLSKKPAINLTKEVSDSVSLVKQPVVPLGHSLCRLNASILYSGHGSGSQVASGSPTNLTITQVLRCFSNTNIHFLGDSQQRNLYSAMASFLRNETSVHEPNLDEYHYGAMNFRMVRNITKVLNDEAIAYLKYLEEKYASPVPGKTVIIIQGYCMWYSYWNRNNSAEQFAHDLVEAVDLIKRLSENVCYIWMPQPPLNTNKQVKWVTSLLDTQMQQINKFAHEALRGSNVVFWSGSAINAAAHMDDYYDFAHPDFRILLEDWSDLMAALGCS